MRYDAGHGVDLGAEELELITEGEGMAMSEVLTTLRSLSQNVALLTSQVKTLQWVIPAIVTFGIAVIGAIVLLK